MSRVEIPMLAIQALDDKYAGNKFVYELSKLNTAARADPKIKKLDMLNRPPKSGNHEVFYETFIEIKNERMTAQTNAPIGGSFIDMFAGLSEGWQSWYPNYKPERFSEFMENTKSFVMSAGFPTMVNDFLENPRKTILAKLTDVVAIQSLHFVLNLASKDLGYISDQGKISGAENFYDAFKDQTIVDVTFVSSRGSNDKIPLNLSQTYTIIDLKGLPTFLRVVGLNQQEDGTSMLRVENLGGTIQQNYHKAPNQTNVLLLAKRLIRVISLMRSTYNFTSGYLNTPTSLLITDDKGNMKMNKEDKLSKIYNNATAGDKDSTFATVQAGVLAVLQEPECWGIIVRRAEDLVFNNSFFLGGDILQAIGSMEGRGRMRKHREKEMYYNTSSDDDDSSSEDESSDEESLSNLGFTQLSIL